VTAAYPSSAVERTRWILERRGPRNPLSREQPHACLLEEERTASGAIAKVATLFLTNRECPWKCAMCDLWRNTTRQTVVPGEIPAQIRRGLQQLGPASVLKLYNSGSFFDPAAIPRSDWPAIAALARPFDHLIVECHPRLVDSRVLEFQSMLPCSLEIAMGLETAHSAALEALNKRITLHDYEKAVSFLKEHKIAVRTFLLVNPPFVPLEQQSDWLHRSIELAFDAGSDVVSLIPLRAGNGAVERLIQQGLAQEPSLAELERAHDFGLGLDLGRVFADTWDLECFAHCEHCLPAHRHRIHRMNLSQAIEPAIHCSHCGSN
jgi:radical SAM enzyme (TIGR01210 family)